LEVVVAPLSGKGWAALEPGEGVEGGILKGETRMCGGIAVLDEDDGGGEGVEVARRS
jgi:hypothetical protein